MVSIQRQIGSRQVAAIGFGCMNLSHAYASPPPLKEAHEVVRCALDRGVTHIIPIPGTTSPAHLDENIDALRVRLSTDQMQQIENLINQRTVSGARCAPGVQKEIDTEEFAG